MKQGAVCKDSAVYKQGGVCGYKTSSCDGSGDISNPPSQSGSALQKFTQCTFNYGVAVEDAANRGKGDYVYFWMGHDDRSEAIRTAKQLGKTVAVYTYMIAFDARKDWGLQDCNVGHPSLCEKGANYIRQNRQKLVDHYAREAKKMADILGRDTFAVYMIEPDLNQYHRDHTQESGPLSGQEIGSLFHDFVKAIKDNHPGASIAWDISPWLPEWEMRQYWGYFASSHSMIDFLVTSGGRAQANSAHIHSNGLTWRFMHDLTKRPIISDTGYGVGGAPAANSGPWYDANNINARASEGVVAVHFANGFRGKPGNPRHVC